MLEAVSARRSPGSAALTGGFLRSRGEWVLGEALPDGGKDACCVGNLFGVLDGFEGGFGGRQVAGLRVDYDEVMERVITAVRRS